MAETKCVRCKRPTTAPVADGLCGSCVLEVAITEAPELVRSGIADLARKAEIARDDALDKIEAHPIGRGVLDFIEGRAARRRRERDLK